MNSFFSKVGRVLAIVVLGVGLLLTTACNNGDLRGARPENPPVQMGGGNNPYKRGDDGYANYKMSTDARAKDADKLRSSADMPLGQLIAARIESDSARSLLYPGDHAKTSDNPDIGPRGLALQPEPMPAPRQAVINRGDPDEKILEKIGQQFQEASEFIEDSFDDATETR